MPDMKIHEHDMACHIEIIKLQNQNRYGKKYIGETKQRKNIIITKMRERQIISRLLLSWRTGKLEHGAQKDADKGNIIPAWQYQRALKGAKRQDRKYILNKTGVGKQKRR